jgi:recombination protein RecR
MSSPIAPFQLLIHIKYLNGVLPLRNPMASENEYFGGIDSIRWIWSICTDHKRENGMLCVVEGPGDQLAIEKSGAFQGRYHVLQGVLSPLDGIGIEDLRVSELMSRLKRENIKEIILALNPTVEGEATASYLTDLLRDKNMAISRIAFGIPLGGDLKYIDTMTLKRSLDNRSSCDS